MSTCVQLKLFPDNWFRKMTKSDLKEARLQLRAMAMNKELDTSLVEVILHFYSNFRSQVASIGRKWRPESHSELVARGAQNSH